MPKKRNRIQQKRLLTFLKSRYYPDFGVIPMKCGRLYTDILSSIHSVISSEAFLCRSVKRNTDFSRRRKLSFTDYVYLTVQNLKSSLQVGLNVFIDAQKDGEIAYSKQAFSKGR